MFEVNLPAPQPKSNPATSGGGVASRAVGAATVSTWNIKHLHLPSRFGLVGVPRRLDRVDVQALGFTRWRHTCTRGVKVAGNETLTGLVTNAAGLCSGMLGCME